MLYWFLQYSKVDQVYVYICHSLLEFLPIEVRAEFLRYTAGSH